MRVTGYLTLALLSLGVAEFEAAYRGIAWLCWVPNLIAAELLLNWTSAGRGSPGWRGQ